MAYVTAEAGLKGIVYIAAEAAPMGVCEFLQGLNRLASKVQPAHWNWPENVLRTGDGGISIPPRLAGLGIQGFPGVSTILEGLKKPAGSGCRWPDQVERIHIDDSPTINGVQE